LEHFVPLLEQGIAQASRRVLAGEQLPAAKKILSLFEEHTQIITRHKAGKPREFGRKVLIEEVDGCIITDLAIKCATYRRSNDGRKSAVYETPDNE
jgi:transposase, IS5 family